MGASISRRGFIETGSATIVLTALAPMSALGQTPPPAATRPAFEKPPPIKPEDVQAFVGVAHRDINRVRDMLDQQPWIVNATWDWGGGDWESAMGAAGHTGGVEIAELLFERGGRIELHCAAMLGWLDVVKAAVAARPGAENILGPHAIPMWSHAWTGGERASEVLAYLESLNALRNESLNDAERAKYVGRYRIERGEDVLTVLEGNRRLLLQPPERRAWFMLNQGNGMFRPADDVKVKITFEMDSTGTQARAMNIDEGDDTAVAVRIE
jgi:hypothetical protein